MKLRDKFPKMITCPRCGLKSVEGMQSCQDCGLIFSRLDLATNKDAKRKIKRGDKDFILRTSRLPKDVSFIKLLLLCIFLGPVGAHNYYTGRYWRGGILSVTFFCLFIFVIFNQPLIAIKDGSLLSAMSTVCGIIELMWLWDILMIVLKKFKVPVAIDLEGESKVKERGTQENSNEQMQSNTIINLSDFVQTGSTQLVTKNQTHPENIGLEEKPSTTQNQNKSKAQKKKEKKKGKEKK